MTTQDTTLDKDPHAHAKSPIGIDRLAAEWTKRAAICHAKAQASDNVMDSRWLVGEAEALSRAASELRQSLDSLSRTTPGDHAAALAELNSDFDSFIGHHAATEASCAATLAAKDEEIARLNELVDSYQVMVSEAEVAGKAAGLAEISCLKARVREALREGFMEARNQTPFGYTVEENEQACAKWLASRQEPSTRGGIIARTD